MNSRTRLADYLWLLVIPAAILAFFIPEALAQVVTTTTTSTVVTLDALLSEGQGVYDAFKVMGILGGISASINMLINITKYGPVAGFIKKKGWKWLRPIMALVAGLVAGAVAGLAEGKAGLALVLYVVGGTLSGGGAIAIHEVIAVFKGDRK